MRTKWSRLFSARFGMGLALMAVLHSHAGAADREARFREYDARRKETLEKMSQGNDLDAAVARLYSNKDIEKANRIVMEADFGKIYWANNTVFIPLHEMFNADTGTRAKLLSREATDKIVASLMLARDENCLSGRRLGCHRTDSAPPGFMACPSKPWRMKSKRAISYQLIR